MKQKVKFTSKVSVIWSKLILLDFVHNNWGRKTKMFTLLTISLFTYLE